MQIIIVPAAIVIEVKIKIMYLKKIQTTGDIESCSPAGISNVIADTMIGDSSEGGAAKL